MSSKGLEVIDHTVQLTHEWINEMTERLDWSEPKQALRLMRVTLHELRDRLPVEEVAQLSAQLPLLIRGMFFEGWSPGKDYKPPRSVDAFVASIEKQVGNVVEYRGVEDIEEVFRLLENRISWGETEDIRAILPSTLRTLWP